MISFWRRVREFSHFLRSMYSVNQRLLSGMWQLTKLHKPAISIFGGSRLDLDSHYAKHAYEAAYSLAKSGFSIITGGGPGVMEAANRGAFTASQDAPADGTCKLHVDSVGIGLVNLNLEKRNKYVHEYIELQHFFERKWLLVRPSIGFIIFPGGFGTMDELFEIITLVQTKRMARVPIVLFGAEYWKPALDWVHNCALRQGMIEHGDASLISVTDEVSEAVAIIKHLAYQRMREMAE